MKKQESLGPVVLLAKVFLMGAGMMSFPTQSVGSSVLFRVAPSPTPPALEGRHTFPSVDTTAGLAIDPQRERRSRKYGGEFLTIDLEATSSYEEKITTDWEVGVDAMPFEKSSVVALGRIARADAVISYDRRGIYSEFTIELTRVFKNATRVSLTKGNTIVAERDGGIARLTNGTEIWVRVAGQRMPQPGKTYLFFLDHNFLHVGSRTEDFHILTAYEISNDRVFPLDLPPQFRAYSGVEANVLIRKLTEAERRFLDTEKKDAENR